MTAIERPLTCHDRLAIACRSELRPFFIRDIGRFHHSEFPQRDQRLPRSIGVAHQRRFLLPAAVGFLPTAQITRGLPGSILFAGPHQPKNPEHAIVVVHWLRRREPIRFTADQCRFRGIHLYDPIGRLKDSATIEQARAEMEVISKQLESQYPESNAGHVANLIPLRQELTGRMQSTLAMLMWAVFLLIVIACANVASLLLARASGRKRETALRLALGCDRMRLLAQSLVESSVLAIVGAELQGRDSKPGERIRMHPRLATPGYLETMGIPVRAGRVFSASDAATQRRVAVISEITAKRYWPNESALGKRFRFTVEGAPWLEVVGVVGSVHNRARDREPTPDVYLPFRENQLRYVPTRATLVIKSSLDASGLGSSIRQAVASIDHSVSVADIRPFDSFVDDVTVARRFILLLVTLFAAIAVVLAASGFYGLLSFVVGQRTGEISVRMALGASRSQILREVLAHGVRLAGAGILIGLCASLALASLMSTLLFGVHPNDPFVLGAITCILLGVAVLTTSVPAWRASKVEPLTALRTD